MNTLGFALMGLDKKEPGNISGGSQSEHYS